MTLIPPIDTTHKSPNYNSRPAGALISALVIHSGEGRKDSDLAELTTAGTQKSAHYYVDRAGLIYQLVPTDKRAWHAGESSYLGRENWNDFSIGIETEHRYGQDWPAVQQSALTSLCRWLIGRYPIPRAYVVTHRQIAPERKGDPTNWSDAAFTTWADQLYITADPLRARTIEGPNGKVYYCGEGFYRAYYGIGRGPALLGLALGDETRDGDSTFMRLERAILKYTLPPATYGVELALLSEAKARGWLL